LSQGTPADILLEASLSLNIASTKDVVARSRLETGDAEAALQELLLANILITLEEGTLDITSDLLVIPRSHWNELQEKTLQTVEAYHRNYALRRGIPREELKSKLRLVPRAFNAVINKMITDHSLTDYFTVIARPEHKVVFDQSQQAKVQALMRKFAQNPYSPPGLKELLMGADEEILNALMELDELIAVSPEVLFRKQDYDLMVAKIKSEIQQKERITLGEVRDLFNTSRKYAQALLEHLDGIGITMRDGDFRKLKQRG
jgi:selenocysteine-specific elongation factor